MNSTSIIHFFLYSLRQLSISKSISFNDSLLIQTLSINYTVFLYDARHRFFPFTYVVSILYKTSKYRYPFKFITLIHLYGFSISCASGIRAE